MCGTVRKVGKKGSTLELIVRDLGMGIPEVRARVWRGVERRGGFFLHSTVELVVWVWGFLEAGMEGDVCTLVWD